jgi:hypothetical protein
VRQDRASPAKQGERQGYIDILSLHRQSLQNKQCFHNLYAYLSAARNNMYSSLEHRHHRVKSVNVSVSDFCGVGDGEIEEACLLVCHFSLSKGELTYIDT